MQLREGDDAEGVFCSPLKSSNAQHDTLQQQVIRYRIL